MEWVSKIWVALRNLFQHKEIEHEKAPYGTSAKQSRSETIERAMSLLISEHMSVSSVDDLFDLINMYTKRLGVENLSADEYKHCKTLIMKRVNKGYVRQYTEKPD